MVEMGIEWKHKGEFNGPHGSTWEVKGVGEEHEGWDGNLRAGVSILWIGRWA